MPTEKPPERAPGVFICGDIVPVIIGPISEPQKREIDIRLATVLTLLVAVGCALLML